MPGKPLNVNTIEDIFDWLVEKSGSALQSLWDAADRVRSEVVGDEVYLRGIIELSSYCRRFCAYCGINVLNTSATRYRMNMDEIEHSVEHAVERGYGTVVLQAGEDPVLTRQWVMDVITYIKTNTELAVTLSLGEREADDYRAWHDTGADRYLLKIETSNEKFYQTIHPPWSSLSWKNRRDILSFLKDRGYEIGSGVMIGIPGQTYMDLARDLIVLRDLELDMIGCGPYLPHPETSLGRAHDEALRSADQVPNNDIMTYKVLALLRLMNSDTNIPATTALASIDSEYGYERGLQRGANVIMPNITPNEYRSHYEIYPGKVCMKEKEMQSASIEERIRAIGRAVGVGQGESIRFRKRIIRS